MYGDESFSGFINTVLVFYDFIVAFSQSSSRNYI